MGDDLAAMRVVTRFPTTEAVIENIGASLTRGSLRVPVQIKAKQPFDVVLETSTGAEAVRGSAEVIEAAGDATWIRFLSAADNQGDDARWVLSDVRVVLEGGLRQTTERKVATVEFEAITKVNSELDAIDAIRAGNADVVPLQPLAPLMQVPVRLPRGPILPPKVPDVAKKTKIDRRFDLSTGEAAPLKVAELLKSSGLAPKIELAVGSGVLPKVEEMFGSLLPRTPRPKTEGDDLAIPIEPIVQPAPAEMKAGTDAEAAADAANGGEVKVITDDAKAITQAVKAVIEQAKTATDTKAITDAETATDAKPSADPAKPIEIAKLSPESAKPIEIAKLSPESAKPTEIAKLSPESAKPTEIAKLSPESAKPIEIANQSLGEATPPPVANTPLAHAETQPLLTIRQMPVASGSAAKRVEAAGQKPVEAPAPVDAKPVEAAPDAKAGEPAPLVATVDDAKSAEPAPSVAVAVDAATSEPATFVDPKAAESAVTKVGESAPPVDPNTAATINGTHVAPPAPIAAAALVPLPPVLPEAPLNGAPKAIITESAEPMVMEPASSTRPTEQAEPLRFDIKSDKIRPLSMPQPAQAVPRTPIAVITAGLDVDPTMPNEAPQETKSEPEKRPHVTDAIARERGIRPITQAPRRAPLQARQIMIASAAIASACLIATIGTIVWAHGAVSDARAQATHAPAITAPAPAAAPLPTAPPGTASAAFGSPSAAVAPAARAGAATDPAAAAAPGTTVPMVVTEPVAEPPPGDVEVVEPIGDGAAPTPTVAKLPVATSDHVDCAVAITSNIAGSTVYVDGEPHGTVPTEVTAACDVPVDVEVRHARYEKFESTVTPSGGKIEIAATLEREKTAVTVKSDPPAQVTYKGKVLGTTPLVAKLPRFEQSTLYFKAKGMATDWRRIVPKSARKTVSVMLKKK